MDPTDLRPRSSMRFAEYHVPRTYTVVHPFRASSAFRPRLTPCLASSHHRIVLWLRPASLRLIAFGGGDYGPVVLGNPSLAEDSQQVATFAARPPQQMTSWPASQFLKRARVEVRSSTRRSSAFREGADAVVCEERWPGEPSHIDIRQRWCVVLVGRRSAVNGLFT